MKQHINVNIYKKSLKKKHERTKSFVYILMNNIKIMKL